MTNGEIKGESVALLEGDADRVIDQYRSGVISLDELVRKLSNIRDMASRVRLTEW